MARSRATGGKASASARILVVDDDPGLLRLISLRLEAAGYRVDTAESGEAALGRAAAATPDAVITDLRMEGMDGMEVFRRLREDRPSLPVIILTAHGTIPEAVAATREGAFSFLTKPFDSSELVSVVTEATRHGGRQQSDVPDWRKDIVTRSHVMEELLSELELIAESDASVLIRGDSLTENSSYSYKD